MVRKQLAIDEAVYRELQTIKHELEYMDDADLSLSDTVYELIVKYRESTERPGKPKAKKKKD